MLASRVNNLPTGGAVTTWSTIDRPDWTYHILWSNIGPFMLPPIAENYDIIVQNSMNPSVNMAYNLDQKDLRYLNVLSDLVACSNIGFHIDGILFRIV